jgi:hypothetical protein
MSGIEQHLRDLELQLLEPQVRRDPGALSALLTDDFREFGSSGRVYTRIEILSALQPESSPPRFSISDFAVRFPAEGVALVTYRAVSSEASRPDSWRSSVWVTRGGRWQILFHQGTRVS